MTMVMKDSQEGQPKHANFCTKQNRCVSAATFGLGSWSAAFTLCEVYRLAYGYKHPVRLSLSNVWKAAEILLHADV